MYGRTYEDNKVCAIYTVVIALRTKVNAHERRDLALSERLCLLLTCQQLGTHLSSSSYYYYRHQDQYHLEVGTVLD